MMLEEVTAIKTGGVMLKVNGVKLRFDDVSFIPEKYLGYEIKTIGSENNMLVLELQKSSKPAAERFNMLEAVSKIG